MPTIVPAFILIATGFLLYATHGHFHPILAPCLPILWGLFFLRPSWTGRWSARSEVGLWFFLVALFSITTAIKPISIYMTQPLAKTLTQLFFGASTLLCFYLTFLFFRSRRGLALRQTSRAFWLFFGLIGAGLTASWWASPNPFIDVWIVGQEAAEALLSGNNPYTTEYTQVYQSDTEHARYPTFFGYPPLVVLWYLPWKFIFGDIRVGYLFAHLLTGYLLRHACEHSRLSKELSLLIPVAYLAFPIVPFIIEQSWIDSFSMLLGALLLRAYQKRAIAWFALFMGLFLAFKLTHWLVAPLLMLLLYRLTGKRQWLWAPLFVTLTTGLMVTLPFFLWDPSAFIERVFWMTGANALTGNEPFALSLRMDALSLRAWTARTWETPLPASLAALVGFALLGLSLFRYRHTPATQLPLIFLSMSLFYFVYFSLSSWAFCNYYWFATLGIWLSLCHGPLHRQPSGIHL